MTALTIGLFGSREAAQRVRGALVEAGCGEGAVTLFGQEAGDGLAQTLRGHIACHVGPVEAASCESCVLHARRQRVRDRVADERDQPGRGGEHGWDSRRRRTGRPPHRSSQPATGRTSTTEPYSRPGHCLAISIASFSSAT